MFRRPAAFKWRDFRLILWSGVGVRPWWSRPAASIECPWPSR